MIAHNKHFIDGAWRPALDTTHTVVHDSATEELIATVSHGTASEIDAAVKAARAAFPSWSATSVVQRAVFIQAIADGLEARVESMVTGIAAEVGMPLKLTRRIQVEAPISAWRATAAIAADALADTPLRHSVITKEAVGVVGAITPWNYPLHQITGKLAAALAAGCCVVLKPSELAPTAAQALGEAIAEAGLPNGVVNIVLGDKNAGEALVRHPGVDLVSFTGSTAVGKHIASIAGQALKRVSLELGGKSAGIALADADQAAVVKNAIASCFLNSGQTCSAITRLLVPQEQYDDYRAQLQTAVEALQVGDPRDGKTRIGPLVSAEHKQRVQSFIAEAVNQGYDVIKAHADTALPNRGFYVAPIVFGRVPLEARLAQEEVFGPVLTVQTYADEDEAIAIANGTAYGLAGAVWSGSPEHGERIARRMRAGQVDVNGAPFNAVAPFGGFGASGFGREGGTFGIEEFIELRAIQLPVRTATK
ncbi:aldehyde dehydrogenase family protein [Paraburkholderia sediminicola]|uniref:aldehyde dehydrogenase family protein n=1 Tax=Paraburkholderia sediminicola TaxID=458836 RepID=UPI000EAE1C4C